MALPPIFQGEDATRTDFTSGDEPRQRRFGEPGSKFDQNRAAVASCVWPAQQQVVSVTLGGANVNTEVWRLTLTPLTQQQGGSSADWIGPSYIEVTGDGGSLEDLVDSFVANLASSATLSNQASVAAWKRFRSLVTLAKDATTAEMLVATSVDTGATFSILLTPGASGAIGAGPTVVTSGAGGSIVVGGYVTRTGVDTFGRDQVRPVQAGDISANLLGPIVLDSGTEAVDSGYTTRVYLQGTEMPLADYGNWLAYGVGPVAQDSDVYVQLADNAGTGSKAGMVTDTAGAAGGATANLWTMTPVASSNDQYLMQVAFGGIVVVLTYLSDGSATATEISNGLRAQLALYNGTGQPLEGLTGSGTATMILTGPATGESAVVASIGVGDIGEVETTAGVATYIKAPRGETFVVASTKTGSAAVAIPHP